MPCQKISILRERFPILTSLYWNRGVSHGDSNPIPAQLPAGNEPVYGRRLFPGDDPSLKAIDSLLDAFHKSNDGPMRMVYLGKMFFAVDAWLNTTVEAFGAASPKGKQPAGKRTTAMKDFRDSVLRRLMDETHIASEAGLRTWLEKTFGASVNAAMVKQDQETGATYYTAQELENYRLRFVNGSVYMQKWWDNSLQLTLFDTARDIRSLPISLTGRGDGDTTEGFANFVLTIDGEFYSTFHRCGNSGRFHSAYTGGKPVHCAGEMEIRNGVITQINNKSGHYTPDIYKLRDAVEVLSMLGVNVGKILVGVWTSKSNGRPERQFNGQELLDLPARYLVEGNESRQVVLGRRAAGIEDVMLTPIFRGVPPAPVENYAKLMDTADRLLAEELSHNAERMKLRIVPLRPAIKARLDFNDWAPTRDVVKEWGVDLVLTPQFDFDLKRVKLGRLMIACHVVSKQLTGDVLRDGYIDLTSNPASLMLKIPPTARDAIQTVVNQKD